MDKNHLPYWKKELVLIAEKYNTTVADIIKPGRKENEFRARKEYAVIMRYMYGWSLPKIGRIINRDHTTVINYFRAKMVEPKEKKPPAPITLAKPKKPMGLPLNRTLNALGKDLPKGEYL